MITLGLYVFICYTFALGTLRVKDFKAETTGGKCETIVAVVIAPISIPYLIGQHMRNA